MVSLPFSKVPANAGIVALTAALLGILAWFGSSAPLGSYFDLGKADAAAFSVSCLQLEYLGYPTYDKYVPCRVTMNPGARIQVGYPNKYNGKLGLTPGPSQDVRPFNWGIISTEPGWSCSQPHSMGLVCDPNGDASGTLDIGFEAVGDCGTSVNIWATQMPVGQGPKSFADDGTWVKTVFTFPQCPAVQASSSSVAVSSISSSVASSSRASSVSSVSSVTSSVSSSSVSFASSSSQANQCSDGYDNDGDGKTDAQDPGCSGPNDNDEFNASSSSQSSSAAGNCADGRDNEGDGKIDANDPDCHSDGNPNNPNSYVSTNWEFTFTVTSSSSRSSKSNQDDDLDVTIEASATEAFPGGSIEYVITIENDTGDDLKNLIVTASFDEDDFTVTDDGDADDEDDGELVWEIGDLDDGDDDEVEFRLKVKNGVNPGALLNVEAEVRADDGTSNDDDVDVRVIGTLPQTGGRTMGGANAYLTKVPGGESSSSPWAPLAGLALTGVSAGAYVARKAFLG